MLHGTALLPPIAADIGVVHDPPQPSFEVRSWLECPEAGISVEHCFLHQILRIRSIGGHLESLPVERLEEWDEGAFKLSAQRVVRHRCLLGRFPPRAAMTAGTVFPCLHRPSARHVVPASTTAG